MRESDARKVDEVVEQLVSQLSPAVYDIGFFNGTVDNPLVSEKISHSFSGHALDIAIRAVAMKIVLFVTRSWDKNGHSIMTFLKLVETSGQFVGTRRRAKHPDWPDDFLEIGNVQRKIDALHRYSRCFKKQKSYLSALRYRNEHLAHLLEGKSDLSKSLKKDELEVEELTYREVLALGKSTATVISNVEKIWRFSLRDPREAISISEKYTRDFWRIIPKLSELED